MKKLKVLSMAAVAAGMVLLTSCLGKGSNESTGSVYGVVGTSEKDFKQVVYGIDGGVYYIPAMVSDVNFGAYDGDCVGAYGSVNFDGEENANAAAKGYLTMVSQSYGKFDKGYASPLSPADTSSLQKGELTIGAIGDIVSTMYVKNNLFVFANIQNQQEQKNQFRMAYDLQNVSTVEGKRVYEFYLRALKTQDGKGATSVVTQLAPFGMSQFFTAATYNEKGKNEKSINFRINYIKEFNKDTTDGVWTASKVFSFAIPEDK